MKNSDLLRRGLRCSLTVRLIRSSFPSRISSIFTTPDRHRIHGRIYFMENATLSDRVTFLKQVFTLILFIAALHLFATAFYFYWIFWWYDLVLHFLGGFWVATATLWLVFYSGYIKRPRWSFARAISLVIVSTIIIGILWEVFEVAVGANFHPEGYWPDTSVDIIMDTAGALTAYLYFLRKPFARKLINSSL